MVSVGKVGKDLPGLVVFVSYWRYSTDFGFVRFSCLEKVGCADTEGKSFPGPAEVAECHYIELPI